jgi:magnesium chelatase family protein
MGARDISATAVVKEEAKNPLEAAINKLGLSARAYSRVLKVSQTIADLPAPKFGSGTLDVL